MRFLTPLAAVLMLSAAAIAAETPRAAGPMEFTSRQGREISLESYRGKPVLVMYFSTDCSHCQRAADVLAPIYAQLKSKGVEFVGVTLNPTAETNLGTFIEKHKVAFPVGLGDRAHWARFTSQSVMARFYYPYIALVDAKGNIQEEHHGAERVYFADLDANLRAALAKLLGGT